MYGHVVFNYRIKAKQYAPAALLSPFQSQIGILTFIYNSFIFCAHRKIASPYKRDINYGVEAHALCAFTFIALLNSVSIQSLSREKSTPKPIE